MRQRQIPLAMSLALLPELLAESAVYDWVEGTRPQRLQRLALELTEELAQRRGEYERKMGLALLPHWERFGLRVIVGSFRRVQVELKVAATLLR